MVISNLIASLQQHLRLTTPYLIVTRRLSVGSRYPADRLGASLGVTAGRVGTAALQLFVDGGRPRWTLLLHQLWDDRLHRFRSLMNNTRITSTGCLTIYIYMYEYRQQPNTLKALSWSVWLVLDINSEKFVLPPGLSHTWKPGLQPVPPWHLALII